MISLKQTARIFLYGLLILITTLEPATTKLFPPKALLAFASPMDIAQQEEIRTTHPDPFSHQVQLPTTDTPQSLEPPAFERVDLRTRNAQVFQRPDGSGYALVYMRPVHFQAQDGNWYQFDNHFRLDETGASWRNQGGDFQVMFSQTLDSFSQADALRISSDTQDELSVLVDVTTQHMSVGFKPLNAAPVKAIVDGSMVLYPEVYPGVDLRYSLDNELLKEDLIFHYPPSSTQFSFLVYAGGRPLRLQEGGAITVVCRENEECLSIMPPYMEDANGETSEAIQVNLDYLQNGYYVLTYEPEATWLHSPEREFPVILDPTVTAGSGYSTYIQSGFPDIARCNINTFVSVGYNPGNVGQGYTRGFFHLSLPSLPAGSTISSAIFWSYQYYSTYSNGYTADIYRVTSDWANPQTCGEGITVWTWNNPPGIDWGTKHGSRGIEKALGWKEWTITSLVQQWYSGVANRGLAIVANPETARGSYFCSSTAYANGHCGVPDPQNYRPYAVINYLLPANPRVNNGVNFSPPSPIFAGQTVAASFQVRNDGEQSITLRFRATTNGAGEFAETSNISLAPGASYTYNQSRSFTTLGSFNTCAQMNSGSGWQNIPTTGTGSCATLQIRENLSISGQIKDEDGQPMAGVSISSSAGRTITTNEAGQYMLTELADGEYVLTPSKTGYIFSPSSRSSNVPPSSTGQDFTGMAHIRLTPSEIITSTPYARHIHTLTLANRSTAPITFSLTHTLTSTSSLEWSAQHPVSLTVGAESSTTLPITVVIPTAEVKWMTNTLLLTATAQETGAVVMATLQTSTGGIWNGAQWVGCRFDVGRSGRVNFNDAREVYTHVGGAQAEDLLYDFGHSGRVNFNDVRLVYDHIGMDCLP